MGDAYKGLTIKLGGDADTLTRSLQTVNRAARETQSKLRLINKALKSDPHSANSMANNIKNINQQAEIAGSRLKKLQTTYSQLGKEHITIFDPTTGKTVSGTVADIAKQTKNVALVASEARSAYNAVDAALENVYKNIKQVAGIDLRKSSNEDIANLVRQGKITEQQAQRVLELRDSWHQASEALQGATKLAQFERMSTEIDSTKANVRGLASELVRLDSASDVAKQSKDFAELDAKILACDRSMSNLKERGKALDEALKVDPSNVNLVAEKIKNLKDQVLVAQEKAGLLREKISSYPAGIIKKAADSQKNWALEVEKTGNVYAKTKAELESTQGALDALVAKQKELELLGNKTGAKALQPEIDQLRQKVELLGNNANKTFKEFDTAKACNEVNQLSDSANTCAASAKKANDEISSIGKTHVNFGSIRELGQTLSSTVTSRINGLAQSAVQSARDVDSAFRDMKKTVNGTPQQFQDLKQAAIEFSTTHVTSPNQILEIEAMGGQLGVSADKLKEFAKVASDLDIATDIDSQDIAKSMGQLSNILGDLNHDNLNQFADSLVRLGNNMPTQESAILDVTNRIGSMGSIAGMSTPEILAWSAAIASTGQKSESAGTAISKTMSQIETAVAGANNGITVSADSINAAIAAGGDELEQFAALAGMSADEFVNAWSSNPQSVLESLTKEVENSGSKLEAFAEVAGISAKEFANKWKNSPSEAMKSFVDGLKRIKENGGSVDKTLEDMGITGVRQKQALEGLVQTVDTLDDALQMSNDAWKGVSDQWGEAGDAAREAQQKSEGFSGALAKLENIGKAFGAVLGDAVAPILNNVVDVAKDALDVFTSLDPAIQTNIVGFLGLVASAGPALHLVGGVGQGIMGFSRGAKVGALTIKELANNSTSLTGALEAAMTATGGFENAGSLATKVAGGLKAGLIGLAIAGVAFVATKLLEAKAKQDAFNNAIKDLDEVSGSIGDKLSSGARSIDGIGDSSKAAAPSLEELTKDITDYKEKVQSIIQPAEESIGTLGRVKAVIDKYAGAGSVAADEMGELQWAVDKLNEVTGKQYKIEDILAGKYKDEKGNVKDLREEIDKLIRSRQLEAETKAYQDLYTESLKEQEKGRQKKEGAQSAYDKRLAEERKKYMDGTYATYDRDKADQVARTTLKGSKEDQELEAATANLERYTKGVDDAKKKMNALAAANSQAGLSILSLIQDSDGWSNALKGVNLSADELSAAVVNAGMNTDQLKALGISNFAALAASAGGDVEDLTRRLKALDALGVDPKKITVNDDGTITTAEGQIINLNNMTIDGKPFTVTDDGSIMMSENALKKLDKAKLENKTLNVITSLGDSFSRLDKLQARINRMHGKDLYVTAYKNVVNRNNNGISDPYMVGNAAGGIRYHADGFIADRPTMISDRDMVGEAGGEAIIPLTNKRYVTPFAGTVADEFIRKLGIGSNNVSQLDSTVIGSQIAQSLNGAKVVLDTGETIGCLAINLKRRADMNVRY